MKKIFLNFVFMFSLILSNIFIFCGCNSTIKEETKYKITFIVDNQVYSIVEFSINEEIDMPDDPIKEGYTFNGWYLEAGFENEIETIDTSLLQNYNLYAKWNIETYTITYHLDNGTNGNNPSNYTINTNDIILEDASKTGYTFNGWYLEAGFENEI